MADEVSLAVVGSVALDTVETPVEKREDLLGGSVSYACAAASYFGSVGMVGVVGHDFPESAIAEYNRLGINLDGLQHADGKTFRWAGVYEENMNNRETLSTDLNVFADFRPTLPEAYRKAPFLFLANISPDLQVHILDEADGAEFVVADTMDLWINIARADLEKVISAVDMLMLNDSEAQLLTSCSNPIQAARQILDMGPEYVVVKKGEHGAVLVSAEGIFMVPAYPLESVFDPTGAGDTFAGGFMGSVVRDGEVTYENVKNAMLYGTVMASFTCESFSTEKLSSLDQDMIDGRLDEFRAMITV